MPDCTLSASWQQALVYVLPPVGALLSAIALWVAAKARSISGDAQSTSQAAVALSLLDAEPPSPKGSGRRVSDRRKL